EHPGGHDAEVVLAHARNGAVVDRVLGGRAVDEDRVCGNPIASVEPAAGHIEVIRDADLAVSANVHAVARAAGVVDVEGAVAEAADAPGACIRDGAVEAAMAAGGRCDAHAQVHVGLEEIGCEHAGARHLHGAVELRRAAHGYAIAHLEHTARLDVDA